MKFSRYTNTEYNRQQRLLSRIKDAISSARHFRQSAGGLDAILCEIRDSHDWRKAPRPTRDYLQGWIDAMREQIMRDVRYTFVTPRGPVSVDSRDRKAGGLTSEELHIAGTFPSGFAWPPDSGKGLAWYTLPKIHEQADAERAAKAVIAAVDWTLEQ